MNYRYQNNLRLFARNEGKLKSYDSCRDVRAWSHDVSVKDRYLKEWMKSDMPIYVLPVSTLTRFLRTMTCRSRRKVAPRCHPDCKSKVLLDSICTSCHAMRECLKKDDHFDKYFVKYFVEEDLETSHWPCEKCLEALKSIKMFWKIIVDKIFNINIPKCDDLETNYDSGDNIKSVAKTWQAEIVHQSLYVKNVIPVLNRLPLLRGCSPTTEPKIEQSNLGDSIDKSISKHISRMKGKTSICRTEDHKREGRNSKMRKRVSRGTNVDITHCDVGCDTCFIERVYEEITAYKKNIQVLQNICNDHEEEVDKLKRQNNSLMIELENVYKSSPWKAAFYCPDSHKKHTLVPKPFDTTLGGSSPDPAKDIDSEIVITMKKCKNKDFRNVSLLQVLHKSNQPTNNDFKDGPLFEDKDPIQILTKVQNNFGAIVEREMKVVNEQRRARKPSDIDASFHTINVSKSAPSCSTLSSRLSSDMNFASAKENTS